MDRRSFLASLPALALAGCVGGDETGSSENAGASSGWEPDGVVVEWGETVETDGAIAVEPVGTPVFTESLTYFDDDGDEHEYNPEDGGYRGVGFFIHNRSGSEVEFPGIDGFGAVGDSVEGEIAEQPADDLDWDSVDEHGVDEVGVTRTEPIDADSNRSVNFTLFWPDGAEYVRWEHDFEIDGKDQPMFWEV